MTALIAGSLFAGNQMLRAADTNQPPATPSRPALGMRGPGMMGRLNEQLQLTDDQKPKVQAIMEDQMKQVRDMRTNASLSPEERRSKMQAIHESTSSQMKAVLTPEQYDKWTALTQRGRQPFNRPPGANPGATNTPPAAAQP